MTPQQANGATTKAKQIREKYDAAPNLCLYCNAPILSIPGVRLTQTRVKRFCNSSCAAQYNNRAFPKRSPLAKPSGSCEKCKCEISFNRNKAGDGYRHRRLCGDCLAVSKATSNNRGGATANRTKGDLFKTRKNWQSARSSIQRHARDIYLKSGKPQLCAACGYSRRFQVCHIRDVSDFPDSALVSEINDIANLVALCPNHHAEFDEGELVL